VHDEVKVSVIVPVYNAEDYLRQCLDTILAQTFSNIELIIVDDGSTDASLRIAQWYEAKDKRIIVLSQERQNAGVARNRGLEKATGNYLSFLDADDYFAVDMLERMVATAELNKADVVICRTNFFSADNPIPEKQSDTVKHLEPDRVYAPDELIEHMFDYAVGWPWDKLFSKRFILENTLQYQSLSSTNDAFFVLLALVVAQRTVFLDEYLVNHRVNNTTSIEANRYKSWENSFLAIEAIESELQRRNLFSLYEIPFLQWVYDFTLWNFETLHGKEKQEYLLRMQQNWLLRLAKLNTEESTDEIVCDYLEMFGYSQADLLQRQIEYHWAIHYLEKEKEDLLSKNQHLESLLDQLRQSKSYRIGRAITKIPRLLFKRGPQ
jgi:glycosyltransferase involved in cell wall biosynthesis